MSLSTLSAELQAIKAEMEAMDFCNNLEYIVNFDPFYVSSEEELAKYPQEWVSLAEPDDGEIYVWLCCRFTSDLCLSDMSYEEVLKTIGADKFPELVIDCVEL